MNKKEIIPPDIYTREYYLSDNEGHKEFSQGLDHHIHDKFKRILELVHLTPNSTILDIGCGRGELVYYCVKRGAIGFGIDYSQDAIDIANEIKAKLPADLKQKVFFERSTAEEYSYQQQYDYIFMIETAEHMYDWQLEQAFSKIQKVLKKDGLLIVTTPNHLYEDFFQPIKMFINTPFRFFKLVSRIIRGKYKPTSFNEFARKLFRFHLDRGEMNNKMHGNVMTPQHLRYLLRHFNATVTCEDHSINPLSLIFRRWFGRQLIAVAKIK